MPAIVEEPPAMFLTMMIGFPGRKLGRKRAQRRATISVPAPGGLGTIRVTVFPAKETGTAVGAAVAVGLGVGDVVGFDVGEGAGLSVGVGVGVALGVQANRSTRTRQTELNNIHSLHFFITAPPKTFS